MFSGWHLVESGEAEKRDAISRRLDKKREEESSGTWYKYEVIDW